MSDDLNKLDLLIKVMRMTESDNSHLALVAINKANAMLKAEGWDWERLLRGKVKVIADPFSQQKATPAPEARPAHMAKPQPTPKPWSPPPQPAPDPFAGMGKPKPKPAASKPQQQQTAPAGPLHFRRNSANEWCIASHIRIDSTIGQKVRLEKRDGTKTEEVIGPYCEQLLSGHFLYKIGKAGKWKAKFADQTTVEDLF